MLIRVLKQVACGLFFLTFLTSQGKRVQTTRNQRLLKILGLSPVLLFAAGLSLPVYAATSVSDMVVAVNVNASCTMSVTSLDFGIYDPFGAHATQDLTASATVSANCTPGTTGVVTMSPGDHLLFCVINDCLRQLANAEATSFLSYNIYTDANYFFSGIWNHDVGEMSAVARVVGSGVSQDLTVYGEIPKNQTSASAGSYTDTINVTVTY